MQRLNDSAIRRPLDKQRVEDPRNERCMPTTQLVDE